MITREDIGVIESIELPGEDEMAEVAQTNSAFRSRLAIRRGGQGDGH